MIIGEREGGEGRGLRMGKDGGKLLKSKEGRAVREKGGEGRTRAWR